MRKALKKRKIQPDENKLRELVIHIARQSEGDTFFGAVKLTKLLFFADFLAYRAHGRPITGSEYQKLEHGPAPRQLKPLLRQMESRKLIAIRRTELAGYIQQRILALREPDLGRFSAKEIALVDDLIRRFWDKSASEISDLSHRFAGWQLAKHGETIPYSVALIGKREPTESERRRGLKLERVAKARLAS